MALNNSDYLAKINKPKYITNELLQAMDMIAQARNNELAFDKTIIAEIASLNNAETGEYYVEYQQSKFKAYAPVGLGYVYNKGTSVYVKIPNGDFSSKKLIEGKASSSTASEEDYDFMSSNLVDIGEVFNSKNNIYGIMAYAQNEETTPQPEKILHKANFYNSAVRVDEKFKSLFLAYPTIKISADFKTEFIGDPISGNYGLAVEFYTESQDGKEQGTVIKKLEIANFVGSLQEYEYFSPQQAIYKISDNKIYTGIKSITFFQERYDKYYSSFDNEGNVIAQPNIFVKNINITFVDEMDNTESLYYCGISAPKGLSVIYDSDIIELEGKFYYALKNILSEKNCQCLWFKRVPSVVPGDSRYNKIAGAGWEKIEGATFNKLSIKGSEVYQKLAIKLIIIYNSSLNFSSEVVIDKYYNSRFAINKTMKDQDTYLELLDGFPPAEEEKDIEVDWYVSLEDGSYYLEADNTKEIKINNFLDSALTTFFASIILEDGSETYYEYQLKNLLIDKDVRVVFAGVDAIVYDKDGNLSNDYNAEIKIEPIITTKSNVVVKKITWFGPSNTALYELPLNFETSMMSALRVDTNNNLYFKPISRFNQKRNANTLSLRIETSTGETFNFNKTIVFSKEGTQGTNGLTYSLRIAYVDSTGAEIKKQPLVYRDQQWSSIKLKPILYANGEEVKNEATVSSYSANVINEVVKTNNIPQWSKKVIYEKDDIVIYNNQFWKSLITYEEGQTVIEPDAETGSAYWELLNDSSYLFLPNVTVQKSYETRYNVQSINVDIAKNDNEDFYTITGKSSPISYDSTDTLSAEGQYFARFVAMIQTKNTFTLNEDKGTLYVNGKKCEKTEIVEDEENKKYKYYFYESPATINYYFPILIGYGAFDISLLENITIPDRITYNEKGTSPSYSNEYISVIYNGIEQVDSSNLPSGTNKHLTIVPISDKYYIYPIDTYEGALFQTEVNKGTTDWWGNQVSAIRNMTAVKVYFKELNGPYLIQPVVMLLQSELNKGLAGYDGTNTTIKDENNPHKGEEVSTLGGWSSGTTEEEQPSNALVFFNAIESFLKMIGFYDADGILSNYLGSDGSFSLGSGGINYNPNAGSDSSTTYGLRRSVEPTPQYTFNEQFMTDLVGGLSNVSSNQEIIFDCGTSID